MTFDIHSHAVRILHPWAGPHADAIMNLGLLAGCRGDPHDL